MTEVRKKKSIEASTPKAIEEIKENTQKPFGSADTGTAPYSQFESTSPSFISTFINSVEYKNHDNAYLRVENSVAGAPVLK